MVLILMAFLAVLVSTAPSSSSYCNLKSCKGSTHTLCKYPFPRTSDRCGKVTAPNLTSAEIQDVIDTHNKYRGYVASGRETRGNPGPQPGAINLGPLKWDKELAEIAQTWADQCKFGHDNCRNVERFLIGQNVAVARTTGNFLSNISDLVTLWYDEVAQFDRNQVKSVTNFNAVGHYTQMMWADTTVLGCGVVRYNSDGKWNSTYLVCNYGPTGNWIGGEMYKSR